MMERRSRSIESPSSRRRGGNGGPRYMRRYSRSRSRSREHSRDSRRRNSRSRSRDRGYRRGGSNEDLYGDLINDDYREEQNYSPRRHDNRWNREDDFGEERERFWNDRGRDKGRNYEREYRGDRDRDRDRDYDRDKERKDYRGRNRRYDDRDRDGHSDDSDDSYNSNYYNKTPSNTIIVMGLQPHITEADIMNSLIHINMAATSIRLIRKRQTGASRGFAFVEFNTIDEAARWMEITQGQLTLQDQTRAQLQYSHSREQSKMKQTSSDWYCGKCGVFNFKRRESCFKCYASREGGEGSEEVSNILTKKIMLRNLDALTNEESVLTALQQLQPDLTKRISKIIISRDALTQMSRGICYLHFDTLVDSMNLHNALNELDPPLNIDDREVAVTYCMDHENRQIVPKKTEAIAAAAAAAAAAAGASSSSGGGGNVGPASGGGAVGPMTAAEAAVAAASAVASVSAPSATGQYTLADVPRLAEYSAAVYASTPAEHAHYLQYYTDFYISEINQGHYSNLPQLTEANSGAAVALNAIQRKQKKMNKIETTATQAATAAAAAAAAVKAAIAAQSVVTPKGNDGKIYPTPDVTLYQYDETSGYYYDPATGLYYDAHSQYYYNNETGAYLYWDQRKSTYILATPGSAAAAVQEVTAKPAAKDSAKANNGSANDDEGKKDKKEKSNNHDKVKVAKKIVKDMEKWAKQLNQKKDYTVVATPQPILKRDDDFAGRSSSTASATASSSTGLSSGYADVGFSILEKKERSKLSDYTNKLVSGYGSESDDEQAATSGAGSGAVAASSSSSGRSTAGAASGGGEPSEKDYVDFQKLTCLLCKRAFQSLDILQKHLKMSNLHKENLQKYNMLRGGGGRNRGDGRGGDGRGGDGGGGTDSDSASGSQLSYRDRAKERRLKYGESDPPPPNRSRERFEHEMKSLSARAHKGTAPAMPIGSNNVGNRLLQKMGWSEGQGLGRKNQGRTNIIEAESRSSTAGLGTRGGMTPGDDYKTYIKKMMKSRYESV